MIHSKPFIAIAIYASTWIGGCRYANRDMHEISKSATYTKYEAPCKCEPKMKGFPLPREWLGYECVISAIDPNNAAKLHGFLDATQCYSTVLTSLYDGPDSVEDVLLALLARCYTSFSCIEPMWYWDERPAARVLYLAVIVAIFPVDAMSGDFDPEIPSDDKDLLRLQLIRLLSKYRYKSERFCPQEREQRIKEIEYVEQNAVCLRERIRDIVDKERAMNDRGQVPVSGKGDK